MLFQIRVVASDGGTPPLTAMTLVQVYVNRNLNAPRFENSNYEKEILETQPLGLPFVEVDAMDDDSKVGRSLKSPWLLKIIIPPRYVAICDVKRKARS